RAALQVGLEEIPCILKDLTDQQILEIALVENLQRKDLHPFEEADGLKTLFDKYQYTHEQIGDKIGKSRSSVTETLTISKIEPEVRDLIFEAQISAKSLLLAIAKCEGLEAQRAMIEKIRKGAGRDAVRQDRKKQQKPKPYVFQFKDPAKSFKFDMRFKRSQVSRDEVLGALRQVIDEIENDPNWS
ncbi:MAG: ParB/RepB/Spo0J family partition protein, partial [Acidobacteria bacterium]|nr:ParB/RepB/Spo0J family partition protein [Acidobacteriota bacterium]